MAFENDPEKTSRSQRTGVKQVSSQPSMFTSNKKEIRQNFEQKVDEINENINNNAHSTATLSKKYIDIIKDKTLEENRNLFNKDIENDVIVQIAKLAKEINNDPSEAEGMGTLTWTVILLKVAIAFRNRLNEAEFKIEKLEKMVADLKK
jgi:hypothetical protein